MTDIEKSNLILGAITLGFVELGNDVYKCTKEQLCELCSIVAASAVEQILEEIAK